MTFAFYFEVHKRIINIDEKSWKNCESTTHVKRVEIMADTQVSAFVAYNQAKPKKNKKKKDQNVSDKYSQPSLNVILRNLKKFFDHFISFQ